MVVWFVCSLGPFVRLFVGLFGHLSVRRGWSFVCLFVCLLVWWFGCVFVWLIGLIVLVVCLFFGVSDGFPGLLRFDRLLVHLIMWSVGWSFWRVSLLRIRLFGCVRVCLGCLFGVFVCVPVELLLRVFVCVCLRVNVFACLFGCV